MFGQVADLAIRIEHTRTLLARLSITQQFQEKSLLGTARSEPLPAI
jgi:hypothetical protein